MNHRPLVFATTIAVIAAVAYWSVTRTDSARSDQRGDHATLTLARAQETQTQQRRNRGQRQRRRQQQQGQGPRREPSPPPVPAEEAGVPVLSSGDSYDDFPSLAQTSDGTVYAAYAAYYDGHDQIRLHRQLEDGRWSTRVYVPLVERSADIWMPQLAVDANDQVWVIWCEQTDRTRTKSGNWDVYARPREESGWGPLVRLSDDPKPDINHHVTTDAAGNIFVVWQAHPENNGDIMLCRYDGQRWSPPATITDGPEGDWYPRAAVDEEGTAWLVFDSYRNGDYDVFLTKFEGGNAGPIIPVATSKYYEAHASVACGTDGRVWIAWEEGGWLWGKDQGYWLARDGKNIGSTLGNRRTVRVASYKDGELLAAPDVTDCMGEGERQYLAMTNLAADGQGRVWLKFRHRKRGGARRGNRFRGYWTEQLTYLTPDGWKEARELAGSVGRISVFGRMLAAADGSLYVAYSSDRRGPSNYHQPIHDRVLVAQIEKPDDPVALPELAAYEPPDPPENVTAWDSQREGAQVERIRKVRTDIDGRPHRIVRGDLHRHTELSWDVGPGNDGSYLDFYRYMIDVAEMDFGGLTDHQGGGHYAYWWHLSEKSSDMYYLPPRFVPLYGYERSVRYPNGHRNVFHSYRGVPIFPFQIKLDQTGTFPGVGTGVVVDNDTKLLYEFLHKSGGVAISHTSATRMGTDWRDNDPEIEPVVEIYQGARNNYEALGAPRVHDIANEAAEDAPGGFEAAGMVWNALAKGYRLGTITSSDHGSTHISYALVYTPENEREAIIESIKKRQTYGSTDNLVVDLRADGHFMGQEYETSKPPTLEIQIQGTAALARLDIVRNNRYLHTVPSSKDRLELSYTDMSPEEGLNYYYVRVLQDDGELGWSSPIWVNYRSSD